MVPARAILDGIERHLDQRLIGQAVETARRRRLISGDEIAVFEAVGLMPEFPVKNKVVGVRRDGVVVHGLAIDELRARRSP